MTRQELISEIKRIEIASRNNSRFSMSGTYRSALKGTGMEIAGFKEYSADDDYRAVDWNVSARSGKVYSRIYQEERENPVFFIVDTSYSMYSGGSYKTGRKTKIETAAVVAAIIAFSAVFNSDRAGSVFLSDAVEKEFRLDGKSSHIADMVFSLLDHNPCCPFFDIPYALTCIPSSIKKGCCFVISDFKSPLPEGRMHTAGRKTDLVFVRITDPSDIFREGTFSFNASHTAPASVSRGLKTVRRRSDGKSFSPEVKAEKQDRLKDGGGYFMLAGKNKEQLKQKAETFLDNQKRLILREGIHFLDISTEDNLPAAVSRFFRNRKL